MLDQLETISVLIAAASAGVAAWQIGLSRQTAKLENRAYVQVRPLGCQNWDSASPGIIFQLINHGRTPAVKVKTFVRLVTDTGLPVFSAEGLVDVGSEAHLWPGQPVDFARSVDRLDDTIQAALRPPDSHFPRKDTSGQMRLNAHVAVTYWDVFGQQHTTAFSTSLLETRTNNQRDWRFEDGREAPPPN